MHIARSFDVPRPSSSSAPRARPLANDLPESAYDGGLIGAVGQVYPPSTRLEDVPPIKTDDSTSDHLIVAVNGIRTTLREQRADLQALAEASGDRVVGVHNATGGFVPDMAQALMDKDARLQSLFVDVFDRASIKLGRSASKPPLVGKHPAVQSNPATKTLTNLVWQQVVEKGGTIHLLAHSQGGIITANALAEVSRRLRVEQQLSPDEVERVLSRCTVETFGAAVHSYVNGPKYMHYLNTHDWVPFLGLKVVGLAGKGAQVHRFADPGDGARWKGPCHKFETYLRNRQR